MEQFRPGAKAYLNGDNLNNDIPQARRRRWAFLPAGTAPGLVLCTNGPLSAAGDGYGSIPRAETHDEVGAIGGARGKPRQEMPDNLARRASASWREPATRVK